MATETKPKFTPGPWGYDPEIHRVYSVQTNTIVAAIHVRGNPACEAAWPGDARLIAAAPDLYAAGEALVAAAGEVEAMLDAGEAAPDDSAMWEAVSAMRAALRRARGEG